VTVVDLADHMSAPAAPGGAPVLSDGQLKPSDGARLMHTFGDVVVQRVNLALEQEGLERIMKQKTIEFEKSRSKHSDFPSVAELETHYRRKYQGKLDAVNRKLQATQQHYDTTTASFGKLLQDLTSPAAPALSGEDVKQELANLRQQMLDNQAEAVEDLRKEVQVSYKRELEVALSLVRQETQQILEAQAKVHRQEIQTAQSGAISLDKLAEVRKQNAALAAEVRELRRRFEEDGTGIKSLQAAHQENKEAIQLVQAQVSECESQIGRLDFDILDKASESLSFDLPVLKKDSAAHHEDIRILKAERGFITPGAARNDKPKSTGLSHVATGTQNENSAVDQKDMVSLLQLVEGHTKHLQSNDGAIDGLTRALTEKADSSDVTLVKAAWQRADASVAATQAQLSSLQQGVQDVDRRLEGSQLMLQSLSSQFNGISTKNVADMIVGHMEQLYPQNRQIVNQLETLRVNADRQTQVSESLDQRVSSLEAMSVTPDAQALGKRPNNGVKGLNGWTDEQLVKRRRI
jgi:chromosome segregation ATPase